MEIAIIPHFLIKKIATDFHTQNNYNILISNIIIIVIFLIFGNSVLSILNYIPHFCLIDELISIECPVCGTTRAFCELSKGNFIGAYSYNKTSILVALFFISQIPLRLIAVFKIVKTTVINIISKYFSRFILISILINWIIKLITNY